MVQPWVLAVDFGTTNTAAAVCEVGDPARAVEVKLSTASTVMPSAVLATGNDAIAGEVGVNSWVTAPTGSYERTSRGRVGDGAIILGDQRRDVAELIAAVLTSVLTPAARRFNGEPPAQVRLTHPAKWAVRRLEVLRDAATRAQLPDVTLVPEPVAAAAYYANRHDAQPGNLFAVYDLGGGTLDGAILRRTDDANYDVLATDGVDPLGGETFELLQDHVAAILSGRGETELADLIANRGLNPAEQRNFTTRFATPNTHCLSCLTPPSASPAAATQPTSPFHETTFTASSTPGWTCPYKPCATASTTPTSPQPTSTASTSSAAPATSNASPNASPPTWAPPPPPSTTPNSSLASARYTTLPAGRRAATQSRER